jgi:hypothetical protein
VGKKRRKTARARLKQLIERPLNPFRIVAREGYWRDQKNWVEAARAAFDAENLDEPIRLAFEAFKLDPQSPVEWRHLLYLLASIHFGMPKGKAGKPKVWRDNDWCELLADYYQVAARNPANKKSAVCRSMKKDKAFSDRYWFSKKLATVRRNVNRALDRKQNKYLKLIDDLSERRISVGKDAAKRECRAWTKRDELLARSSACVDLIPAIEALSTRRGSSS